MELLADQEPMYQYLGMALYQAQAFEYALVSLYAEGLRRGESLWAERLQKLIDERQPNRMLRAVEMLVLDLDLPSAMMPRLHAALEERSWLLYQCYHEFGRALYDESLADAACQRIASAAEVLREVVSELNETLFDRQLAEESSANERQRIERAILHYLEQAEIF